MDDLRKRLQRLGVTTGRDFQPTPPPIRRTVGIETLLDGRTVTTTRGECFVTTGIFPADHLHGPHQIGDWHGLSPYTLAAVGNDRGLEEIDLRRYLFLDTETTGLGGGAFAFLVGIGFFNEAGDLVVEQYFLRDPAEEVALLTILSERLPDGGGLVTFNGRTFDVPLLSGRFIRSRMPSRIESLPNLDLLAPARRLWKRRLPSCSLGALEVDILGMRRTGEDVPGYLIPALYNDYLRTGNASHLTRVFYHNREDILSMVALGITLTRTFGQQPEGLHVIDRLSLARWYHSQEMLDECEAAYRLALDEAPDEETLQVTLHGLAHLLKRSERRNEALLLWERLADLKSDVLGHEELAKHYEWHGGNLALALDWTERGIALAQSWRPGIRQRQALNELERRRERLLRKIDGRMIPEDRAAPPD